MYSYVYLWFWLYAKAIGFKVGNIAVVVIITLVAWMSQLIKYYNWITKLFLKHSIQVFKLIDYNEYKQKQ